eukprot:CAMPEP_0178444398 /NCGR_PEP_ID=MMETSP0689_2-20121128/39473_1 /TAXON_ID=160604 /ORGANISM="Amphidinium massartii, Strain CS-259" /LENGTH=353 /DNA_ID=CAMNT_0020068601 /DNA_START=89 /DNA_END=1150 /DNA_ORIENTATION=-
MGEGGAAPWIVLGVMTIEVGSWITLMSIPYGWQRKMTLFFLFDAGLYQATVSAGPAQRIAAAALKGLRQTEAGEALKDIWIGGRSGTYSLSYLQSLFCQHTVMMMANFCDGFEKLYIGSLVMVFTASFGIVLFLLGGYFYYYYWFVQARKKTYNWMIRFLIGAPVMFTFGLGVYAFLASDVNRMDPPNVPGYYYSFFAACGLTVGAWLPLLVQLLFIGVHPMQAAEEEMALEKKKDAEYGSSSYTEGAFYGTTQGDAASSGAAQWGQQYPPSAGYGYDAQASYTASGPSSGYGGGHGMPPPAQAEIPSMPLPPSMSQGSSGPTSVDLGTGVLPVTEGATMPELRARTLGPGQL